MKQQYLKLFAFLIGISLIVSGVIYVFTDMYKAERRRKREEEVVIADEIADVYKTFFDLESNLTHSRDELMKAYVDYSSFYSNMPGGYAKIKEKINEYETKITEVEDASSYLKDKCVNRYSVLSANDKCNAYYINLEKTINVFINDLELFNNKIEEFNKWTEEENASVLATVKYEKLEKFVANKYTKYVDLNNDETFLGKNVD